ncbi:hypothetical protein [Terrarubrum flagellatum]|uniref:hypothetical protein n=1 Tax=Terrirubrum flagellatum TaxID=2895980 RepID=UPI003144F029
MKLRGPIQIDGSRPLLRVTLVGVRGFVPQPDQYAGESASGFLLVLTDPGVTDAEETAPDQDSED